MNEMEKQRTFEERMKDRIRDSIGELMTDEELSRIVSTATQEIFFKNRIYNNGFHTREEPPFVHALVKELLESQVRSELERFMADHEKEVKSIIENALRDGVGSALVRVINDRFSMELFNFKESIVQNIQQGF